MDKLCQELREGPVELANLSPAARAKPAVFFRAVGEVDTQLMENDKLIDKMGSNLNDLVKNIAAQRKGVQDQVNNIIMSCMPEET